MSRVAVGLVLAGSLALASCAGKDDRSTQFDSKKSLDKMSTEEWCSYYKNFLSNPQLSEKDRAVDIQRMRSRGCANV